MLTRLEVDGFKNLTDTTIDFGPFTCIAGQNGTGKSNVFDAIQFLSLLADTSMMEAAQRVRGVHGERSGDPRDLFYDGYAGTRHFMDISAEMIVPAEVEDDFGRTVAPTMSFLRYELQLGFQAPTELDKVGRLVLLYERLEHINQSDAQQHLRFRNSIDFRKSVIFGRRAGQAFISTSRDGGEAIVQLHQDGGSRGKPRPSPASRARSTLLSTVTQSDDPTVLAARREMQSWRRIALEPSALRASDQYVDPKIMETNGAHMAGALYRIAVAEGGHADRDVVYSRVGDRLSDLSGLRVVNLKVDEDDVRERLTIQMEELDSVTLPARSLSEGTLRFLALCVLLEDPTVQGLLCMEEPENGIHPANLESMVSLVQDLAVDATRAVGPDNPFRQVIINTHSPFLVRLVSPDDLLFATNFRAKRLDNRNWSTLVLRPLTGSWRARQRNSEVPINRLDILPYLSGPSNPQLTLDDVS